MLVLILTIVGLLALVSSFVIIALQQFRISRGKIAVDPEWNGPEKVSVTLHAIFRFLIRRSIHLRKFLAQYILHFFVRVMFYLDKLISYLYSKSRNTFVSAAVRNRGTVPHFWEHLKVYKQEMDREKEED